MTTATNNTASKAEVDVSYEYFIDKFSEVNAGMVLVTLSVDNYSVTSNFCKENEGFNDDGCGWSGEVDEIVKTAEVDSIYDLVDFDEVAKEYSRGFIAQRNANWNDLHEQHKDDFKSDANFECNCYFGGGSFEFEGDGFIRLTYNDSSDTLHYIDEDDHDALLEIEGDYSYTDANRVLKVHALFTNNDH